MQASQVRPSRYGARPVSVDLLRGRTLCEPPLVGQANRVDRPGLPLTDDVVADRLSLAHWPAGHRVVVGGLAGGTGRTTIAGLMATVLAELPYAHVHAPVALTELRPRTLSSTWERWGAPALGQMPAVSGVEVVPERSGPVLLEAAGSGERRGRFSVVVVEAPPGLPCEIDVVIDDPAASVVLVIRPDRRSLAEAAEALVWMQERSLLARRRVTVAINCGAGSFDRGSRAAATALGTRCAAVHRISYDSTLGPREPLPSGRDLPARIRRVISRLCLDVWREARPPDVSTR